MREFIKVFEKTPPYLHPDQPADDLERAELDPEAEMSGDDEEAMFPAQDIPDEVAYENARRQRRRLEKYNELSELNEERSTVDYTTRSGRVSKKNMRYAD